MMRETTKSREMLLSALNGASPAKHHATRHGHRRGNNAILGDSGSVEERKPFPSYDTRHFRNTRPGRRNKQPSDMMKTYWRPARKHQQLDQESAVQAELQRIARDMEQGQIIH